MNPPNPSPIIAQLSLYLANQFQAQPALPPSFDQLPTAAYHWLQQVLAQHQLLKTPSAPPQAFEDAFNTALQQNPAAASYLATIGSLIPTSPGSGTEAAANTANIQGDHNILIQNITSAGDTTIILNKRKPDGN